MEEGLEAIRKLYKEEAYYFKNNKGHSEKEKSEWFKKELDIVLNYIDKLDIESHNVQYLKGCVLNIGNKYNVNAEEKLIDAAKMSPTTYEIWNELGDCIWKKGDKKGARNCFERAINQKRNKVSLRNLSIVMRQQDQATQEEIQKSVTISKEAVALDVTDGTSWYILGNAYLSQFFHCGQASNVLKCSLNAYTKAQVDDKVLSDPDYYYNKGIVSRYLDDYNSALSYFTEALTINPHFVECKNELDSLTNQLEKTKILISNKGKLKGKKITAIMKTLKDFSGSQNPANVSIVKSFSELSHGHNKDKAINCILVSSIVPSKQTPFVCICIDSTGFTFPVNIYNVDSSKAPKLGDAITIPYPNVSKVSVTLEGDTIQFDMIRIESPLNIMVNGRQLSKGTVVPLRLTTTALT